MNTMQINNSFARFYTLTDKERFPSFDPDAQGKREETIFYGDFKTAEAFVKNGSEPDALEDTWNRAWQEWRNNAAYVTELCVVMNHLCWENESDVKLCKWYADKYHYCYSRIFSNDSEDEPLPEGCANFSEDEKSLAFDVLD